ncbi:hypothetical protein BHE74_00017545 [Ensete ventricosum]|nr:hypothetical protein BHE74_00017545 [Ensete ventricosum]RZS02112.1 hypothetical protein BHM03_00032094 [Ensete ventricosum]
MHQHGSTWYIGTYHDTKKREEEEAEGSWRRGEEKITRAGGISHCRRLHWQQQAVDSVDSIISSGYLIDHCAGRYPVHASNLPLNGTVPDAFAPLPDARHLPL